MTKSAQKTAPEWSEGLRDHVEGARARTPIPQRDSLSLEDEHRCRINGGWLLAWLRDSAPGIITQRRFFEPDEAQPLFVFTTDFPGLVAARAIVGDHPSELVYLLDEEFEEWMARHDDGFEHHIHLWAKLPQPDPDFLDRAQTDFGPADGQYWKHSTGTLWGLLAGGGADHLWVWDGRQSKLVKLALNSWVT